MTTIIDTHYSITLCHHLRHKSCADNGSLYTCIKTPVYIPHYSLIFSSHQYNFTRNDLFLLYPYKNRDFSNLQVAHSNDVYSTHYFSLSTIVLYTMCRVETVEKLHVCVAIFGKTEHSYENTRFICISDTVEPTRNMYCTNTYKHYLLFFLNTAHDYEEICIMA
jgi:hypothetical protein